MRTARLLFVPAVLLAILACDPTPPADDTDPGQMPCSAIWTQDHTPIQVDEYVWNGAIVYHADFGCCDRYLEVYDQQCDYVCAPSGGFAAGGDGRCPTFYDDATATGTVWTP